MSRRALIFFLVMTAFSLALSACGGGGGSTPPQPSDSNPNGVGSGGNGNPAPGASPTTTPNCNCVTIKEKATKDQLLGGITLASDNRLYATTPVGVDIFDQQLDLLPSPSPAQARHRETWPTVPKNSGPIGLVVSTGQNVNVLGTTPGGTTTGATAFSETSGPVPTPSSQPILAQFNVNTGTWFNVTPGNFGDKWVSLAALGTTSLFVVADTRGANGWTGFIIGFGIACVSPVFSHPLGASAMGPDGNLWIATDPSLNSNSPSDPNTNPSILYAVNTSTGAIVHAFTLPKGSHVSAIAAGTHAVWFTDNGLNELGEVQIGGSGPTLIPLPNKGTAQSPVSITQDSIGRMWFTEFNGKRVGYIVPSTHAITIFNTKGGPIGIIGCVPGQMCPPTNVFFAENAALGAASF